MNTFAGIRNVIDEVRNNNVNFHSNYVHFKGDTIVFNKSYDKKNLTLVVISYEIYLTPEGSFNKTSHVRSSIYEYLFQGNIRFKLLLS